MSSPESNTSSMFLRVSPDDIVLYGNRAIAEYFRVRKDELAGTPLQVLQDRLRGEIKDYFGRPKTGRSGNCLVTDSSGRVFELKSYSQGGVLDLILDEVTDLPSVLRSFSSSIALQSEQLSEEEIRSIWQPERRILSVAESRLCNINEIAERESPVEMRLMLNLFAEEAADGILANGGAIADARVDALQGIFGAPRYYKDHALRALNSAFYQLDRLSALRSGVYQQGKEIPPIAAAVNTGEVLLTSIRGRTGNRLSVAAPTVDLTTRLLNLARPGEVLISEFTLQALLQSLPANWEALRAESETRPDLSDMERIDETILPLSNDLEKTVYLVGPNISQHSEFVEIYFDYLYSLSVEGFEEPVPILRAVRPESAVASIELSEENIVSPTVAQVLGKYRLISLIGQGGMGKVWKGRDRFGNWVAIKVLNSADDATDDQVKRFKREAEIMGHLPHRNICRVFEINEFEGVQYIAMEFIDGLTLADLLYEGLKYAAGNKRSAIDLHHLIKEIRKAHEDNESAEADESTTQEEEQPRQQNSLILPLGQTLAIFIRVCDAVQFAHEHGILHRDLKPGNILLREDGEPFVADFGLAKTRHEDHSLSLSGHVVGTLENMAPEQAESSKNVDERADVFSLGTILYQMLTGRRHFEVTGNFVSDGQALKDHTPVKPRQYNPTIDTDLELICLKALRTDPNERYRSVAALQADIERYRRGEVISAKPVSAFELAKKLVQRNRTVSLVALGSLIVFFIGAVVSVWQINERRHDAELARKDAEEHALAAQQAANTALQRTREAESALERLKKAQLAKTSAEEAAKEAKEREKKAQAARENERNERLRAEEEIQAAQDHYDKLLALQANEVATEPSAEIEEVEEMQEEQGADPQKNANFKTADNFYRKGAGIVDFELTPFELVRLLSSPTTVLKRLDAALNFTDRALILNSDFTSAWILKTRLHLLLFEPDAALSAAQNAQRALKKQSREKASKEQALFFQKLFAFIEKLQKNYADSPEHYYSEIVQSPFEENLNLENLAYFFQKALQNNHLKTSQIKENSERVSVASAALNLIKNSRGIKPSIKFFEDNPEAHIQISNASDLSSLKAFVGSSLKILEIDNAKTLDWESIGQMNLESLKITNSEIPGSQNLGSGSLTNLKELQMQGCEIADLDFLRKAVNLESLDLQDSQVKDLSPILALRRLKSLRMPETEIVSLVPLNSLPLEELTLPETLRDKLPLLDPLFSHRTLQILRFSNEPETQSRIQFRAKIQSGAYKGSE
ncbi:MAG: protein kinase domain-containing protein [Chthoniobacterales bacterium]